jgi:dTDP-glucose pyrophosphorylase
MINILLPMAGKSPFFDSPQYYFPKPLVEISGTTMIQMVIDNLNMIDDDKQYIFVVNQVDCTKHHFDDVLRLLTDNKSHIVRLEKETKGAACSALMAVDYIDNDTPLIIANSDQLIEEDLNDVMARFREQKADAGVICFENVHPRWSYVRLDEDDNVIETAEKRPLSRNAIAGFYYFTHGKDFVRAAMRSIQKDARVNELFYIAPTLNELVLEDMNIRHVKIDNSKYHTFYSPQKIHEYEQRKEEC